MNEALTEKQRFWFAHLEAADNTGLSIADYAKANNLDALARPAADGSGLRGTVAIYALPDPEWLAVLLSHAVVRP